MTTISRHATRVSGEPRPPSAQDADVRAWGAGVVAAMSRGRETLRCSVYLYDAAAEVLRLVAERPAMGDLAAAALPDRVVALSGTLCGWVQRSGLPALVADARHDPELRADVADATRSELAVPIVVGAPVGVLSVASSRVGAFGIGDVHELEEIASDASAALVSAGLC